MGPACRRLAGEWRDVETICKKRGYSPSSLLWWSSELNRRRGLRHAVPARADSHHTQSRVSIEPAEHGFFTRDAHALKRIRACLFALICSASAISGADAARTRAELAQTSSRTGWNAAATRARPQFRTRSASLERKRPLQPPQSHHQPRASRRRTPGDDGKGRCTVRVEVPLLGKRQ